MNIRTQIIFLSVLLPGGAVSLLPGLLSAQSAVKDREANDCYQAKAAYGGDQAACLVILFQWEGNAARAKAREFQAEDRRLLDSMEKANRDAWQAEQSRLRRAALQKLSAVVELVRAAQEKRTVQGLEPAHSAKELGLAIPSGFEVILARYPSDVANVKAWWVSVNFVPDDGLFCRLGVSPKDDGGKPTCKNLNDP